MVGAAGFEPATSTVLICLYFYFNDLQHRGDLPRYAEVVRDNEACGLSCGLPLLFV